MAASDWDQPKVLAGARGVVFRGREFSICSSSISSHRRRSVVFWAVTEGCCPKITHQRRASGGLRRSSRSTRRSRTEERIEKRSSNGTSRIRRVSETGTSLGRLLDCSEPDKVPVGDAPGRKAAQSRNSVVIRRSRKRVEISAARGRPLPAWLNRRLAPNYFPTGGTCCFMGTLPDRRASAGRGEFRLIAANLP
jgi:hypothetical protein